MMQSSHSCSSLLARSMILVTGFCLWHSSSVVDAASEFGVPRTTSSTRRTSTRGGSTKLPDWLTIHKNREKLSEYMALARQRHVDSVQAARGAYFHGGPSVLADADADDTDVTEFDLDGLQFDKRTIQASGSIPDFVDELDRTCFVTKADSPLFTKAECQDMIAKAEAHFSANSGGEWTTLPSGQYDVAGFWIKSIPACHEWFNRMVQERLFPLLQQQFPQFCESMADLVVDNAYVFKYTTETGRRTDVHTDSGCLSFTIALNGYDEYSGGGTWYEGLQPSEGDDSKSSSSSSSSSSNTVVEMNVGQCTVRPGGVRHCGHAVTEGTRYIIGGFCMNVQKVEYVRMLMGLGSEEIQKGNYEAAQEALETAITLNPDFYGPYSHLADLYSKQGKIDQAQRVLEHCFEHVNPESGEIAYSLGKIYLDQTNYDQAIHCMDACLGMDDCDVDAMMVMAQVCAGRQDDKGEQAWYQRIIATPGASKDLAGKAYCNLGVLHSGTEQELEYYRKSLELVPNSYPATYSLACAYASEQQWDPAIAAFRKAIDISDDKSEDQLEALQNLYKVSMGKLQAVEPSGASNREEMMQQFLEIMGEDNYQRLAAMKQQ